jgi:hypothetical protein
LPSYACYNRLMQSISGKWPKLHSFVVQECLALNAACYLAGDFENLPDYVKMVERPAGSCRRRPYLVCPACGALCEYLYLPPTPDPVWRCRKCHGLIYSSQRYGRRHPLRLTPPPRFYAKSISWALPPEYDVTPMLKAQRRKRRNGFAEASAALDVLFQEFERNVYGIPVKRLV